MKLLSFCHSVIHLLCRLKSLLLSLTISLHQSNMTFQRKISNFSLDNEIFLEICFHRFTAISLWGCAQPSH